MSGRADLVLRGSLVVDGSGAAPYAADVAVAVAGDEIVGVGRWDGPAMLYGIRGRGLVRRGWQADLNVIDLGRLGVCPPEISHDFPTGARHLVQRATGFVATVVNGAVTMRDGVHTGALPGRVVRNEAAAGEGFHP